MSDSKPDFVLFQTPSEDGKDAQKSIVAEDDQRANVRTVVHHNRSTPRQIYMRMVNAGNRKLCEEAMAAARREAKPAWHNWAEEMANLVLHTVCSYADRFRKTPNAETIYQQAKIALHVFGSYDGQQPHVQANDKIFECALKSLDEWRLKKFSGNYNTFLHHLLKKFDTGTLTLEPEVQMLREKCRRCAPEPRLYASQLRKAERGVQLNEMREGKDKSSQDPRLAIERKTVAKSLQRQSWTTNADRRAKKQRLRALVDMEDLVEHNSNAPKK